jgi:signal transduction histidine kinase
VLGNAALLRKGAIKGEDDLLQAARDIEDHAIRLANTIDELIEFAQVDQAATSRLEPVEIDGILRSTVEALHMQGLTRVTLEPGSGDAVAMANPQYVERILQNLVSNALKYSPQDTAVEVSATSLDGFCEVQVRDRGRGFEGDAAKLFEPFYRAPNARDGGTPGLGIGLTLCKRLLEAQGGTLGASRREGGGSVFWFRLAQRETSPHSSANP